MSLFNNYFFYNTINICNLMILKKKEISKIRVFDKSKTEKLTL